MGTAGNGERHTGATASRPQISKGFDPRKALCRKGAGPTITATTPDLTACQDRCANIARTDQHIAAIEADITALQAELSAPLTPDPLRHRIQAQITRREVIVQTHHDTQERP